MAARIKDAHELHRDAERLIGRCRRGIRINAAGIVLSVGFLAAVLWYFSTLEFGGMEGVTRANWLMLGILIIVICIYALCMQQGQLRRDLRTGQKLILRAEAQLARGQAESRSEAAA